MERIIDVLPIILLGVGQLMLATVCINQNKRIKMLEDSVLQDLALIVATRSELDLPIFPKTAEDKEEDEHGQQE